MLLTVEGGGLFSSSASGYSKLLSLLLIGRQDEERPMRVLPWNQYQLVEQEKEFDLQLASRKRRASNRWPFFICFGCPSAGCDGNSPPKVGPVRSGSLSNPSISEKGRDSAASDESEENTRKILLRSSLKKRTSVCSVNGEDEDAEEALDEISDIRRNSGRRKIQWTDACGKELVEIREFEPSEVGASEEESERDGYRRCECIIQ